MIKIILNITVFCLCNLAFAGGGAVVGGGFNKTSYHQNDTYHFKKTFMESIEYLGSENGNHYFEITYSDDRRRSFSVTDDELKNDSFLQQVKRSAVPVLLH